MALVSDRNTFERDGKVLMLPVAANAKIFTGALVALNEKGFAEPGTNKTGYKGVGRAEEFVDNTSGTDGEITIRVKRGVFKFDNDSGIPVKGSDVFAECYLKDDETVRGKDSGASAPNPVAGKVIQLEDDGVWVEI